MAKKVSKQCDTPDCDDDVHAAGLCVACYQWNYYHNKAGVAANQQYKKKVRRAAARIERHMPERKVSKTNTRARQTESRAYH